MSDVVLLHGYPLDSTAFAGVNIPSAGRTLRPDLAGFGHEPWPADGDLSMNAQARHVISVMDGAGVDRAVVIGLSMGGYVAFAMAELAPERIASLGIIGSKPEADSADARIGRDRQAESVVREGSASLVGPLTDALLSDSASLMVRARLRTMVERTRVETYVSALAGMRDRPDRTEVLRRFAGPFATMVGTEDPLVSVARNEEIASIAGDGVAIVATGAGHLVPMERPDVTGSFIADLVERS